MGILDKAAGALGTTPLGIGLGAASMVGQIFGAIKSGKEQDKNQALLDKQFEENQADYDNSANKSFLDTNVAKDSVRTAKENLVDARKNVAGRSVITGASDEAKVAANTGAQKNYNDTISHIAGLGTQYQMNEKNAYRANLRSLYGQQMGLNQQKSDGAGNLAANAGDLFSTLAYSSGMKSNSTDPLAGRNQFGRTPEQESSLKNLGS